MTTAEVEALVLARGNHQRREDGVCAMEAVAWLAGEPHSDAPSCTAAPLRRFVINTNDWMHDDERDALKPFLLRLISTASVGREADRKAAFMFADWAVREIAPLALDARKQPELAARLRAVAPIVDKATAEAGRDEVRSVRAAAYAAAAADAYDAAADAYDAAAYAYDAAAAAAAADAAAAAAYAADAYAAAAAARKDSIARRLSILDRILTEAYGKPALPVIPGTEVNGPARGGAHD